MKIIKLSLAALVIIVAAGTSAFKSHPKAGFFTTTWFVYNSTSQTKLAYNTATNYTKESGSTCDATEPALCEIALTAITHTSLGIKTIPVLPAGTGTKISQLNSGGTLPAASATYTISGKTLNIDFKI